MQTLENRIPAEIVGLAFTDIERKILNHLCDGEPYTVAELKIYDKLTDDKTIQSHLYNIRHKIVVSTFRIHSGYEGGRLIYRLVKVLGRHKLHF